MPHVHPHCRTCAGGSAGMRTGHLAKGKTSHVANDEIRQVADAYRGALP
jgi:hypothetical protein